MCIECIYYKLHRAGVAGAEEELPALELSVLVGALLEEELLELGADELLLVGGHLCLCFFFLVTCFFGAGAAVAVVVVVVPAGGVVTAAEVVVAVTDDVVTAIIFPCASKGHGRQLFLTAAVAFASCSG